MQAIGNAQSHVQLASLSVPCCCVCRLLDLVPPPAGIFGAGPDQWASCGRQPLFQIGSFFGGGGFLFDKFKMDVWSRLVFMLTAVKAGSGGVITRDQCNVRSE